MRSTILFSPIFLIACGGDIENDRQGSGSQIAETGTIADEVLSNSSGDAAGANEVDPALCMKQWKAVAVEGCYALSAANMIGDYESGDEYQAKRSALQDRCAAPNRINFVIEQAAREAERASDAYMAENEPSPGVRKLCERSVTSRGVLVGYDKESWAPKRLAFERREQERAIAAKEAADEKLRSREEEERQESEVLKLGDSIAAGEMGGWICKPIGDARPVVENIYRSNDVERNPILFKSDGRIYRGRLFLARQSFDILGVTEDGDRMTINVTFLADEKLISNDKFGVKIVDKNSEESLLQCLIAE